ncbi:MAG TPA: ABC transporter substrate-binding protein [Candidatus Tectomicrobia bacterium]|nr:ABC transporter substrate-binding protein [Candidatus Tectomicrobia bacterium]
MTMRVRIGRPVFLPIFCCLLIQSTFALAQVPTTASAATKFGGVYRRALANNPTTLDPAFVSDIYSRTVVRQIVDGLVQFDAHLNPIPAIAEFWEASRDGLTWTFTLRRGVKFHHGREVTAEDFVYSFTRLLDPKKPSPPSEYFRRIQGANDFMGGKAPSVRGLKAIDRYTLQIVLEEPFAPSLTVLGLANAAVVPKEEVERLGNNFARAPVGTGPFKFVRWESGKEIVLDANQAHYEGRPFLDTIVFRIGRTFEKAFAQFLAGDLEEAMIPSGKTDEVHNDPRYRQYHLLRRPMLGLLYIGFNTQIKPFDDKRVRQAFNYAVNKQEIVREIAKMGSLPGNGTLPPGMPGHDPDLKGYYYNPSKAKRLLAEAGYPNGAGFPVVQLWAFSKAESTKAELAAYQEYLAELGVKVEIHFAPDWPVYKQMLQQGKIPMFRVAWYADIPDPDNFFFPLIHSAGQSNYIFYRNPRVDRLLEEARGETDYAQRVKLYREAERMVMDDAPWITQHNHIFEYLYQPYVQGVEVSLLGDRWIPMNKIWLKRTPVDHSTGTVSHVKTER